MTTPRLGEARGALWNEAPCGLFAAAASGLLLDVNTTFCVWLGYDRAELVGVKRFQDLLPMGARVFLQTHWTPLLQMQGSVSEVALDFIGRDGARVPMLLNAIRRLRDGAIRDEVAAIVTTDRKLYERELLAARAKAETAAADLRSAEIQLRTLNAALSDEHQRKDIFLATLAHELRNPLAPMANVVEVLLRRGDDAGRRQWATEVLSRQVAQMSHLVDDLLDVSRITQGKVELRRKPVDLAQVLRRAVDEAMPAFRAAQQTLAIDIGEATMPLDADLTRLTQIVANLLNNANKYSPPGAHVGLRAWMEGSMACFAVTDNGIGIPPDKLASIFTMFSQLEPVLERSTGGLGIGLALVKGLVELHGGAITAHSEGPGRGSCFTVRLPGSPALPATPARDAEPPAATQDIAPIAIVIVDDNVDGADTLAMALDLLGHAAQAAHSAADGLRIIEATRPAVAVLDIGLPDMNGYELARHLRRQPWGRDMVLIAATGWGQDSDKRSATEAGFDTHFTKPIDFAELGQEIERLMRSRVPG